MSTDSTTKVLDATTDAVQDYIAVKQNGMRPTDRAKERGIAPATVSRNVTRVQADLDNGAVINGEGAQGEGTATVVTPKVTLEAIASGMHPFGAVLYADRVRLDREVRRIEQQIETLTTRMHEATEALGAWDTQAKDSAGFDMEAVRDAYAKAIEEQAAHDAETLGDDA